MAAASEEITSLLVRSLVAEQFPQWSELPIRPVEVQGWDNRTFRLGDRMTVRLPSADGYVAGLRPGRAHPRDPRLQPSCLHPSRRGDRSSLGEVQQTVVPFASRLRGTL